MVSVGGGVHVGRGVIVAGKGVLLGLSVGMDVRVGTEVGVRVKSLRSFVVGVPTAIRVLVGEGVYVGVGVDVGVAEITGVAVGEEEGVGLGLVEVGKGPSSAWDVPAMAVLISSTSFCACSLKPKAAVLFRNTAPPARTSPTHSRICSRIGKGSLFLLLTRSNFLK